jgi:hypothetical protein
LLKRFNRYELKYVVPAPKYQLLQEDLLKFMIPDPHGDQDGFYRIVSLYYDSPDLHFYRSKIEGLNFRRKLRIRIYPGSSVRSVSTGFVEIRQRINRSVQKRRVFLPLDQASALCRGDFDPAELDNPVDKATTSEVLYLVRALHLKPKCVVSYRRQALLGGRLAPGMRVTLDQQLRQRIHSLRVNEVARNHYFLPPDQLVMEVKINERIPIWMTSLIAQHECQLQRFSKYCSALARGRKQLDFARRQKEDIWMN